MSIREARLKSGLSITAAARITGIDRQTWRYAEKGVQAARPGTLARMARTLGLTTEEVLHAVENTTR